MAGPAQFRDLWYENAPPWLRTGVGERYMYTLQYMSDLLCDKANQAVKIRMPGQGDVSQVPYLANDRALIQGPAEPTASFIKRLQTAIPDAKITGSRRSILRELQAYITNLAPGVAATAPILAIVGGSYPTVTTWDTLYHGDPQGALPTHVTKQPGNFNWDGGSQPWRAWLILYMTLVAVGQSGAAAQTSTAIAGSLLGQLVSGVWVPGTSGTAVNNPFILITGLTGMTSANIGQWITMSGSSHSTNNGTFPIISVPSGTTCVVANPPGVILDTGPLTWSIGKYPWISPGPTWGTSGVVFGQGQTSTPTKDTGSNVGGVWQPTTSSTAFGTSLSWGLSVSNLVIQTIRQIVQYRKSAATYYPNFIVCFDPTECLPTGSHNPTGASGGLGMLVAGVWVPTRQIVSPFDCFTQGTGSARACCVENVT